VNTAPAHLESKLRFWDFTVGQIAAAMGGFLLGVAWAMFLCPFDGMWAAMTGAYVGALPVVPVFVASQTEFDLWGLVFGALRWRRLDGRYVPGPGGNQIGYRLTSQGHDSDPGNPHAVGLDLDALWEEP
jgi:hypothetical protein